YVTNTSQRSVDCGHVFITLAGFGFCFRVKFVGLFVMFQRTRISRNDLLPLEFVEGRTCSEFLMLCLCFPEQLNRIRRIARDFYTDLLTGHRYLLFMCFALF